MSVVSRSTLKGYFNTGDRPTESNFADLIDSTLNLNDSNTGDIDLTGNVTASSLTLNKNIVSAANTDAAFYTINGSRGEIRSQLQEALAADTGFTIELRNTSIAANSLIIANLIGGEGGLITGSVVTANVVAANTASLNFFNTGAAVVNDAKFTASFAVL
mgnify:CR=1 FL=1|tara:strand:- start:153 stop:632 length:480 start_codon:yes stop_codon:yes gene_type:complete